MYNIITTNLERRECLSFFLGGKVTALNSWRWTQPAYWETVRTWITVWPRPHSCLRACCLATPPWPPPQSPPTRSPPTPPGCLSISCSLACLMWVPLHYLPPFCWLPPFLLLWAWMRCFRQILICLFWSKISAWNLVLLPFWCVLHWDFRPPFLPMGLHSLMLVCVIIYLFFNRKKDKNCMLGVLYHLG